MKKSNIMQVIVLLLLIILSSVSAVPDTAGSGTVQAGGGSIGSSSGTIYSDGAEPSNKPICGNNICEEGEKLCRTICTRNIPAVCQESCEYTCPQDCEATIPDNKDINVKVPSSFSLRESQTAHVTNYQTMEIRLDKIYDYEVPVARDSSGKIPCTQEAKQCPDGSYVSRVGPNCEFAACPREQVTTNMPIPELKKKQTYAKVSVTTPGGCGPNADPPNADPRCLGPPGFSMSYDIAAGQTVEILGLKLTFEDVIYSRMSDVKDLKIAQFKLSMQGSPGIRNCPENCECRDNYIVCAGTVKPMPAAANGTVGSVTIWQSSEGKALITKGESSAKTSNKIVVKDKKLLMETSRGNKTIKVMPDAASDVAVNQLKLKNYEIELKDTGKPVYEVRGTQEARIFGFIKTTMEVSSQIDAESGNVISTKRPWWSFLTR